MPLSDIANIQITTTVGGLTQQGFGTPLILGYTATWPERVRIYQDAAGVAADFAASTPEYKAASVIFSQNPRPPQVFIGRGALPPTQKFFVKCNAVANSRKYSWKFNGTQFDYTSDASATSTEIATGMVAATATAATAAGFTASVQGTAPNDGMQLLANAAGNWCSLEVLDPNLLGLVQNHVDPGLTTDLDAIALENNDWYHLVTLFNSALCISGAAVWVEAHNKLYTPDSGDTECITVADGIATDIGHVLRVAGYARTGAIYHPNNGAFAGAAWPGVCLPKAPGSETWMFKTLAGVPSVTLTPTHIANLQAKRMNYYYTIAGRAITAQGVVASAVSAFIDIVRLRDWLMVRMQERLFLVLANADKVAYTDPGVAILQSEVIAQLQEGVTVGGVNPDYTVTAGKVALQNPIDKANRTYKGISFNATLQGAVHHLDVTGVLALA